VSAIWERLAGDSDVFAVKVAFRRDPDGGTAAAREEALSWGAFQIWVQGRNICSHMEEGETVDSTHWYLLPMLEWLASGWDALLHEERLPAKNAGDDAWGSLRATRHPPEGLTEERAERWEADWHSWWSRHALQSCRSGGLFPDVLFRRWRDKVEVSWGPDRSPGLPAHFRFLVPRDRARLDPLRVARPLYEVLAEAARFLSERAPDSARLRDLVEKIEAIKTRGRDGRLALQAGLAADPAEALTLLEKFVSELADIGEDVRQAILGVEESPLAIEQPCSAALMWGSVSPNIEADDIRTLGRQLVDLYAPGGEPEQIERLVQDTPVHDSVDPPWEQGYRLAEEVLGSLSLLGRDRDTVDVVGVLNRLRILQKEIGLQDREIRAVAVAGREHRPAVLLNSNHSTYVYLPARRFTLAHELCHILFDRGYGRRLALASGPWAPRDVEKRANAFAAMLLMPPELVGRCIRGLNVPITEKDGVLGLARTLGTGFTATTEHLCNLRFIDEVDRDRLRAEADPQA
jgi:hypothetical protein